jgi:hypothetical protein
MHQMFDTSRDVLEREAEIAQILAQNMDYDVAIVNMCSIFAAVTK